MKKRYILTGICSFVFFVHSAFAFSGDQPAEGLLFKPSDAAPLYKTGASSYYSSLLIRFGYMSCDFTKLNQNGSGKQFSDMPLFAGASFTLPLRVRKVGAFDINFDYQYLLPQTIDWGGSFTSKLAGFSAGLGIGTDVFPKNTGFDLIVSAGFQGGRFKLKDNAPNSSNPSWTRNFFAPQLMAYPRFVFRSLSIGARFSYRFDVLGPHWTANESNTGLPGDILLSGYSLEAVLGIILGKGK